MCFWASRARASYGNQDEELKFSKLKEQTINFKSAKDKNYSDFDNELIKEAFDFYSNPPKEIKIVRGVVDSTYELAKLERVEKVRKIIAERLTGDSSTPITIELVSEAVEDYADESYLTVSYISQLQKKQDIETEVIHLLEEGRITLEPEFFYHRGC